MTPLLRWLLRPFLPQIEHAQHMAPLPDPVPDRTYNERMAQARAARERAERIMQTMREPKSTRPAI